MFEFGTLTEGDYVRSFVPRFSSLNMRFYNPIAKTEEGWYFLPDAEKKRGRCSEVNRRYVVCRLNELGQESLQATTAFVNLYIWQQEKFRCIQRNSASPAAISHLCRVKCRFSPTKLNSKKFGRGLIGSFPLVFFAPLPQ